MNFQSSALKYLPELTEDQCTQLFTITTKDYKTHPIQMCCSFYIGCWARRPRPHCTASRAFQQAVHVGVACVSSTTNGDLEHIQVRYFVNSNAASVRSRMQRRCIQPRMNSNAFQSNALHPVEKQLYSTAIHENQQLIMQSIENKFSCPWRAHTCFDDLR